MKEYIAGTMILPTIVAFIWMAVSWMYQDVIMNFNLAFCQVFLDVFVLNRGFPIVYHIHLLGDDVHRGDVIVLREEDGEGEADVAGAGDGDVVFVGGDCFF